MRQPLIDLGCLQTLLSHPSAAFLRQSIVHASAGADSHAVQLQRSLDRQQTGRHVPGHRLGWSFDRVAPAAASCSAAEEHVTIPQRRSSKGRRGLGAGRRTHVRAGGAGSARLPEDPQDVSAAGVSALERRAARTVQSVAVEDERTNLVDAVGRESHLDPDSAATQTRPG